MSELSNVYNNVMHIMLELKKNSYICTSIFLSLLMTIDPYCIHVGNSAQPLPKGHKFYKLHRHKGYVGSIFSLSEVFKLYLFFQKIFFRRNL